MNGPLKKDGPNVELDVYSVMTTVPNALTMGINHERMPVLLSEEADFETWLSGTPKEAFALARSFDPARMRIVQSGSDKEDLLGEPPETQQHLFRSSRVPFVSDANYHTLHCATRKEKPEPCARRGHGAAVA